MSVFAQSELVQSLGPALTVLAVVGTIWLGITAVTIPGLGAPEIGAAVSVLLAVLGILILPTNLWGMLLLVGALACFVSLIWLRHIWVLPIIGFLLQIVGSYFLFRTEARPSILWIALINLMSIIYYVLILQPGLKIQDQFSKVGEEQLIGSRGQVVTTLDPQGSIRIQGTIWRARSEGVILGGDWVQVVARSGLELQVVPSKPDPLLQIKVAE